MARESAEDSHNERDVYGCDKERLQRLAYCKSLYFTQHTIKKLVISK